MARRSGFAATKLLVAAVMGLLAICFFPAKSNAWTVTVSGTIYDDQNLGEGNGIINGTGTFGTPGTSLVGDAYTETITTDPLLNTGGSNTNPPTLATYGGAGTSAPYTIITTVNGFTYTQTESSPYGNYSYLINGLSSGLTNLVDQDAVYQGVSSSGCSSVYGVCTNSYILAYSTQIPFVSKLDFNHPLHSTDLDPGSNTYFVFRDGPDLASGFYGSIADVRVHPDDLAAPIPNIGTGLPGLVLAVGGLLAWWRRKRTAQAVARTNQRTVPQSR